MKKKLLDRYVKPHKKISREVKQEDLAVIHREGEVLYELCSERIGLYPGARALAHGQIEKKDPLRFFVTDQGEAIINPKILRTTRHRVASLEGCLSFPFLQEKVVQRFNKLEVEYQTLDDNGQFTEVKREQLSGKRAMIFQHEIDHFEGITIYNF